MYHRPIIIAGNSGSGKDSLAEGMVEEDSRFIISKARTTTRIPRKEETSMTFVSEAIFTTRERAGKIIGTYEGIGGHRYGIDTDILKEELKGHDPILPFGGDTLDIQWKYLMDLAWFCRDNGYPIPLYFFLRRNALEKQEQGIISRGLPPNETQVRLARILNQNSQILSGPILRLYNGLASVDNIEGRPEETVEQLLKFFREMNGFVGTRFFRHRHERP